MSPTLSLFLTTGPAALLFAAIFLGGQHFHPFRRFLKDRRTVVSFSAGMSVAYVFVRMMPELNEAREMVVQSAPQAPWLPYEGVAIYFLAMVGFLSFYGLDRLLAKPSPTLAAVGVEGPRRMHLGGMSAYVAMMSYLLVRSAGESLPATISYALAFGGHFLALDHNLCDEFRDTYLRRGRWLMAGSCVAGWGVALLVVLPPFPLALLMAFISGGVIMTNCLMELSETKDGRFSAFVSGSLVYGLLLIPLS